MGAGQATGRKSSCSSQDVALPPLLDSREDGSAPSSPSLPSHKGHHITGSQELMEFIGAVQRELEVSLVYMNTHRCTRPEQRRSRLASSALGHQISESGVDLRSLRRARLCRRNCNGVESRNPTPAHQALGTLSPLPP